MAETAGDSATGGSASRGPGEPGRRERCGGAWRVGEQREGSEKRAPTRRPPPASGCVFPYKEEKPPSPLGGGGGGGGDQESTEGISDLK